MSNADIPHEKGDPFVNDKPRGFSAWESLGIGIPNPRTYARITVPPDLTPEQLASLEAWIDKTNAELEKAQKVNEAEWETWVKGRTTLE